MKSSQPPKIILITGCSSGFGLLMAARLASHGHRVFATMRDLERKEELLKEAARRGGQITILKLDVINKDSIKSAIAQILQQVQRIDVVVNNAGYGMGGFFEDLSEDDIRHQMEVNFFGVQNVLREVIPVMRAQKSGRIINISSIAGRYANPCFSAYNASKWALEGFSESLYHELKPFGIHVSLVEPGTYPTKIFGENARRAKDFNSPRSPYYGRSQFLSQKVARYAGRNRKDPEDVAKLVEDLINHPNPPLRNIPDLESRILLGLRRLLPQRLFLQLLSKIIFWGYKTQDLKPHPFG